MPQINLIPEVLYEPNQPYHYIYDNIPLKNILSRISLVNIQTDKNSSMLLGTSGNMGSLSSRLNESLNDNGSLKDSAIDASIHNIAYHADGEKDGVEYVRMTKEERSKLTSIDSGANFISIQTNDQPILDAGNIQLENSSTIFFELEAPNKIKAHTSFPLNIAHRHVYSVVPSSADMKNFRTSTLSTPYTEGSLRVYINGIRIKSNTYVPIFSSSNSPDSWTLFSIESENYTSGEFVLNSPVPLGNSILIDFDTLFDYSSSSTTTQAPTTTLP